MTTFMALDTETHLIAPGRLAPRLVCVSLFDGNKPELWLRDDVEGRLREIFENPDVGIIAHNAVFDMGVLYRAFPALRPLIWRAFEDDRICCTLVAEKLRRIADGTLRFCPALNRAPMFTLADLALYHLGEVLGGKSGADAWRLRYSELDGVPLHKWPSAARSYAIDDAVHTFDVFKAQASDPRGFPLPTFGDQMRAAWALHLMAAWGLRTDPVEVANLEKQLREKLEKWRPQLQAEGLLRPNGTRNDKAIRARVLTALGESCPLTKGGAPSASNATLKQSGDPALLALSRMNKEAKLLSGFVPILWQATKRPFSPRWNVLVSSGRTSCGSKDNPGNLQNQPRDGGVRRCWVPREGWVYITADYAIAELCALAEVLVLAYGESAMATALVEGRKLHILTASAILGWTYEQTLEAYLDPDHVNHKEAKHGRQFAKIANFGLGGGLGAPAFSAYAAGVGIDLPLEDAHRVKAAWLALYPEMTRYFSDVGDKLRHSPLGLQVQHPVTGFVRGDLTFTSLANHYFQHLVAAGAKRALWQVARESYGAEESALTGTRPVAFVHDEIIVECRESEAHDAAKRLSKVMVDAMQTVIKHVPIEADAAIMRRWYKGAEPVYDRNGRLTPWEPPTSKNNG